MERDIESWIRSLTPRGALHEFYTSRIWQRTAAEIKQAQHNECQHCRKKGIYKRAEVVHHVNPVKVRPDLALSRTYTGQDGKEHPQLIALCQDCHNAVHHSAQEPEITLERW